MTMVNTLTTRQRENRARYRLSKDGYVLRKSRIKNENIHNRGGYMIINSYYNSIEGGEAYDWSLAEVERFAFNE